MGHTRLGTLHRTRKWREVIDLLQHGAAALQVARASVRAAERGFQALHQDPGTRLAVHLLLRLPETARRDARDGFATALAELGMHVPNEPGVFDLAVGFQRAVDAGLPLNRGRTDLGEMTQLAGVEALVAHLGAGARSLFGTSPADIRVALAALHDPGRFGHFAQHFFARLVYRVLDYHLSRVLPENVGEGCRFLTLRDVCDFQRDFERHCLEAASVVTLFTADWIGGRRRDGEHIDVEAAADYVHGGVQKILDLFRMEDNACAA